jgi:hypothetical protein
MTSQVPTEIPGLREEVNRILASRAFRDRDTLRHLLEYLVQQTLDGTAGSLKEYVIGVDVFGKPAGYDPQDDASVRVQIGKLRRKLEEYYLDEGVADSLHIQLPKRHFGIVVDRKPPVEPAPAPPPPEQPQEPSAQQPDRVRRLSWVTLLHGSLTIALAALAIFLGIRLTARDSSTTPELAAIWKPFMAGSRPVLISLGTLQFYTYSGGYVREAELDPLTDAERQPRLQELQTLLHSPQPLKSNMGYTGVGQATAAFLLSKQFVRMNLAVDMVRSNVLSWDEVAQHNVIFVGSAKVNRQLREIPVTWAFRVEGANILNLRPKPGEAASYGPDHSLISLFPGLHGEGEIMIVESGSGQGVWAAAQFLTDPVYAKEMVARLRRPDGQLPKHYQVVIKSQMAGDVPLRISYITHRGL